MKIAICVLILFCANVVSLAQLGKSSPQASNHLGQSESDFKKSLTSGRIVLSDDNKSYILLPPKPSGPLGTAKPTSMWSYGDKSLDPKESLPLDVQVGTRGDKPAYIHVLVPKDKADSANKDFVDFVEKMDSSWSNKFNVQNCIGSSKCVKMCPNGTGGTFCCKLQCE